jgi:dihydrofolate reductase
VRELIADLFVSLDGFAGAEGVGAFFGYPGPELDRWVAEHLDEPQIVLTGRVTYETLAGMAAADDPSGMTGLQKVVFSNTLREPLAWANTRLVRGDAADAVQQMKQEDGPLLRTIGSLTLMKALTHRGLVDRLRLMVFPLVLGAAGREPAFEGYAAFRLGLANLQVIDSRLLALEYTFAGQ